MPAGWWTFSIEVAWLASSAALTLVGIRAEVTGVERSSGRGGGLTTAAVADIGGVLAVDAGGGLIVVFR